MYLFEGVYDAISFIEKIWNPRPLVLLIFNKHRL
jgi:hypothetical protein